MQDARTPCRSPRREPAAAGVARPRAAPRPAGRHDLLNAVELGLRQVYGSGWSLRGFYRFENNAARLGAAAPPSSEVGSYRQSQVGLAVAWSGELWRQIEAKESVEEPEP